MPAPPTNSTRDSCELRHWSVFKNGFWKNRLYTPADVARMAANYRYLSPHLTPIVKLGHDPDQRLKLSLGFPNMGQVTDAGLNPDGSFWIDAKGIPSEVGAQINAGRINTGSVDLDPKAPDPNDPGNILAGPIFLAISLLGEEQPALKNAGLRMPQAVFADGTPVPPATSAAAWLNAMAEVSSTFSAASRNSRVRTLRFSDFSPSPDGRPMSRSQFMAELDRISKQFAVDTAAALERIAVIAATRDAEAFVERAMSQMDGRRLPPAYVASGDRSYWWHTTGRQLEAAADLKGT